MERTMVGDVAEAVAEVLGGAGDGSLRDHLDTGTLLHVPGFSGLAGDYQGADAIVGLVERMAAASDGTLHFTPACTTTVAAGRLRMCGTVRGHRLDRSLDLTTTLEAEVRDGVIREAWLSCADQLVWDAFWR